MLGHLGKNFLERWLLGYLLNSGCSTFSDSVCLPGFGQTINNPSRNVVPGRCTTGGLTQLVNAAISVRRSCRARDRPDLFFGSWVEPGSIGVPLQSVAPHFCRITPQDAADRVSRRTNRDVLHPRNTSYADWIIVSHVSHARSEVSTTGWTTAPLELT